MFTPGEIWSMIGGGAVVVFGAGQVVAKMRNGKYVPKDYCALMHKNETERWERIETDIRFIREKMENHYGDKSQ